MRKLGEVARTFPLGYESTQFPVGPNYKPRRSITLPTPLHRV